MARIANGCVYRPTVTYRDTTGRKRRRRSAFYWCKYKGPGGDPVRHALRLPNGHGVTDREVALSELRKLLNRQQRLQAGMIDTMVENAATPIRKVVADYVRHLRRKRTGRPYIRQAIGYLKYAISRGGMSRLADYNEERIDKVLGAVADAGRSPRTVNIYREHAHALGEWCVKVARIADRNPVAVIPRRESGGDVRRTRRSLLPDEARRLLAEAGPRRLFYAVQMMTGLRVNEVRRLEWRDLRLEGDAPYLKLRAATTKAKRADEIDLNAELAGELTAARPPFAQPTDRVFRTTPSLDTFKRDLERARIEFRDAEGRRIDRHALRTTFVSWLGAAGVDVRVAQRLARHSDIRLTTQTYQDVRVLNTQGAVGKLPSVLPAPDLQTMRATGTADARPDPVVPPVVPVVVPEGVTGGVAAVTAMHSANAKGATAGAVAPHVKPCHSSAQDTSEHPLASAGTYCPGEGSNLHPLTGTWPSTMRVCQFRHPGIETKGQVIWQSPARSLTTLVWLSRIVKRRLPLALVVLTIISGAGWSVSRRAETGPDPPGSVSYSKQRSPVVVQASRLPVVWGGRRGDFAQAKPAHGGHVQRRRPHHNVGHDSWRNSHALGA